jgi:hypothetical protein
MKIKFKENQEQLELIAKMGSKNLSESMAAQEAFARLLSPVVGDVFLQANTASLIYTDLKFREDEEPTFPLELFTDTVDDYFSIWSQALPGGLPTNTVHQPIEEIRFTTYQLDSAISYLAKYARQTRLPVITKALERLVQTVFVKTQNIAWSVFFAALAGATHNGTGHVFSVNTPGSFQIEDYNQLLTFFRRLNTSWVGGTPVGGVARPTDVIVSPETMEKFRAMAYQPINTKAVNGITATNASPAVVLPDQDRRAIFSSGGVPEFFGINVIELLELGVNQPYNDLFGDYIGGATLPFLDSTVTPTETFSTAADDLVIVLDATQDIAYRAIQTDADTGSVFSLEPDDQFVKRSGKIGWYGSVREGRNVINTKGMAALVV